MADRLRAREADKEWEEGITNLTQQLGRQTTGRTETDTRSSQMPPNKRRGAKNGAQQVARTKYKISHDVVSLETSSACIVLSPVQL